MTAPPDPSRGETIETALDLAAEILGEMRDELAAMRRHALIARAHLDAIIGGAPDPPPPEWKTLQ
jgi:hypothetical protein